MNSLFSVLPHTGDKPWLVGAVIVLALLGLVFLFIAFFIIKRPNKNAVAPEEMEQKPETSEEPKHLRPEKFKVGQVDMSVLADEPTDLPKDE